MSAEYSEDHLVQKLIADFSEKSLGWHSVYTFNSEIYGTNGTLGRKEQREVVLLRYLREALEKLNPNLLANIYEDAI